jgi:hypothetical protein
MARLARIILAGVPYHVTQRGREQRLARRAGSEKRAIARREETRSEAAVVRDQMIFVNARARLVNCYRNCVTAIATDWMPSMTPLGKVTAKRFNAITKILLVVCVLVIVLLIFVVLFKPSLGYSIGDVGIASFITAGVAIIRWVGMAGMRVTGGTDGV